MNLCFYFFCKLFESSNLFLYFFFCWAAVSFAGIYTDCRRYDFKNILFNKIRAYKLQDNGADTVDANIQLGFPADGREYEACAQMMKNMGFNKVILMTNNPAKIHDIESHGIEVLDRKPIEYGRNTFNEGYLDTKEKRMGHLLHHQD